MSNCIHLDVIIFSLFGRIMMDCVFVARCNALADCLGMGLGVSCLHIGIPDSLLSPLYYAVGPPTAINESSNASPMFSKGL